MHTLTVTVLAAEWTTWMTAAGYSPRTIKHRLETLSLFARRANVDPVTATHKDVTRFLAYDGIGQSTRWNYHQALKAWFAWVVDVEEIRPDNPFNKLRAPKLPRRRPRPVPMDDLARILSTGMYKRSRTMVLLAALQGMRASEIARMRGDLIRDGWLTIVGKGGHERVIPLHPLIELEAADYPNDGWWFTSPADRSKPILGSSVSNVLSKVFTRAGVHGGVHRNRHWFGTWSLIEAHGNMRVTQELLGHADLGTVTRYTQVQEQQMITAVRGLPLPKFSPRSRGEAQYVDLAA